MLASCSGHTRWSRQQRPLGGGCLLALHSGHRVVVALLLLLGLAVDAWAGDAVLALSADGARLDDPQNHLVWQRCAVGMQWQGGRCAGLPLLMSRPEALQLALDLSRVEGVRYHLPSVVELQRLHSQLLVNARFSGMLAGFAPPPDEWWWTSTAVVESGTANPYAYDSVMRRRAEAGRPPAAPMPRGWAIRLRTGETRQDLAGAARLPVLLVRSTQGE